MDEKIVRSGMLFVRDRKSADPSAEPMPQVPVDTEFITAWKWSTDDEHVHWPRKKQRRLTGTASRTNVQSPRPMGRAATSGLQIIDSHGIFIPSRSSCNIHLLFDDLCEMSGKRHSYLKVKRSALLYEITERTKQLARPRCKTFGERQDSRIAYEICASSSEARENKSRANSKVAKLSPRVLELSRPKIVSEKSAKTSYGWVAPGALRAVATQRILELSEPKKQPTEAPPVTKMRKSYLVPCSPRILNLARPKRPLVSAKGRDGRKNSRRRPRSFFTHCRRKMRKNSHKRPGSAELVNLTHNSRTTKNASRKYHTRSTSSNRSVIVIETLCKPKKLKFGSRR